MPFCFYEHPIGGLIVDVETFLMCGNNFGYMPFLTPPAATQVSVRTEPGFNGLKYTVVHKKRAHKLLSITLANLN